MLAWRSGPTRTITFRSAVLLALGAFALASVVGTAAGGNFLVGAWLIGFSYAWWSQSLPSSQLLHGAVSLFAALLTCVLLIDRPNAVYSLPVVLTTGVALLSAHRALRAHVGGLQRTAFTFPAQYSYSLYLVHFPILIWMAALSPKTGGVTFLALGFVASNVVAIGWWWLTESRYPAVREYLRVRLGH